MEARRGNYQAVRHCRVCLSRIGFFTRKQRSEPRLENAAMPILAFHGVVIHQVSLR